MMRSKILLTLTALFLPAVVGCYHVQPRPLPQWKVKRMQSGARVPCSVFTKGQRLADGGKVIQVNASYVVVRTRDRERVVIPCRVR